MKRMVQALVLSAVVFGLVLAALPQQAQAHRRVVLRGFAGPPVVAYRPYVRAYTWPYVYHRPAIVAPPAPLIRYRAYPVAPYYYAPGPRVGVHIGWGY